MYLTKVLFRLRLNEIRDRLVTVPLNVMRLMRLRERYEVVEDKVRYRLFVL